MLIGDIINDGIGLLSKQLRFYCWHFRRSLDEKQRIELIELLYEQHFEKLAAKIRSLNQSTMTDCRQQIAKLLFDQCLQQNRRNQLIQLVESSLLDIDVRLDNYGRTLLHRSAYNLDVELVKILINYGVNIKLRDYAGNTALHIAIQSYRNGAVSYGRGQEVVENLSSIIRLLLEADKNLQNERNKRKKIKLFTDTDGGGSLEQSKVYGVVNPSRDIESKNLENDPLNEEDTSQIANFQSTYPMSDHDDLNETQRNRSIESNSGTWNGLDKLNDLSKANETRKDQESINRSTPSDDPAERLSPMLLEDESSPLVNTKNAFGRTALHYCVLVVGEQHLPHFVKLLISYGADTDAIDTKMKTPLYCLVKRPALTAIRQECLAITHLIESGCDDLGLAIEPNTCHLVFNDKLISNLERNLPDLLQYKAEIPLDAIFVNTTFKRVPSLKHLSRLRLIKLSDETKKLRRQTKITLPNYLPSQLNFYMNRKILDQTELF